MIWAFWEWLQSLFYTKELDICLVGLPNAGKTTLAGVLTNGEYIEGVSPTVGYNLRQLRKGYVQMKIWDLGGQPRFRTMWERYCTGASAIVFLVDASVPRPKSPGPPASMEAEEKRSQQWTTAREELHTLLTHTSLASVPLLVLATKCDVPGHATHDEVVSQMKLTSIRDREVFCYSISSRTKTNIDVVLRWLCARK